MNIHISLCFVLAILTVAHGVQQYITFFSQREQQGNSVTFIENIPDLSRVDYIINENGSFQALGWWHCNTGKNYTGRNIANIGHELTVVKGNTSATVPGLSCRHNGAPDTNIQAISLYSSNLNHTLGGEEILITGPAYANTPFIPQGLSTTGFSNWTLYTGSNFEGSATCYVSEEQVTEARAPRNFRSVTRNCYGRIDDYLYSSTYKLTNDQ